MITALQYNASIKNPILKTISWHGKWPWYDAKGQNKTHKKTAAETVFIMIQNLS